MYNEILILDRLKHNNVLPFLGVYLPKVSSDAEESYRPFYGIVTPLLENGDILQYLQCNPLSNRIVKVNVWPSLFNLTIFNVISRF